MTGRQGVEGRVEVPEPLSQHLVGLNTPLNTSPARDDGTSDRGVETLSGPDRGDRERILLNLVLSLGGWVPFGATTGGGLIARVSPSETQGYPLRIHLALNLLDLSPATLGPPWISILCV